MEDYQYGLWEKNNGECVEKMNASLDQMYLVQLAMAVICFCQMSFMLTRFPRQTWEAVYLPAVECALYAMAASGNGYLKMANGKLLPWARMASWLATCPVMFIQMNNIAPINLYGISLNNIQIALAVARVINGITASCVDNMTMKWTFFFLGFACLIIEYTTVYRIYDAGLNKFRIAAKQSTRCSKVCERLQLLRGIFFVAWTAFPVIWVFSPQGLCVLGENVVPLFYLMADLACKNAFGVLWYDTTWNILGGLGWDPTKQPKDHIEMQLNDKGQPILDAPSDPTPDSQSVCLSVVPPLNGPLANDGYHHPDRAGSSLVSACNDEAVIVVAGREYVLRNNEDSLPRRSSTAQPPGFMTARSVSSAPRTPRGLVFEERMLRDKDQLTYPSQSPIYVTTGDSKISSHMVWVPHTPRTAQDRTVSNASRIARAESEIEYFAPNPRTASAQPSERVYYRDELQISPEREIAYDELGMQQESDEGDMSPAAARMMDSRRAALKGLTERLAAAEEIAGHEEGSRRSGLEEGSRRAGSQESSRRSAR